MNDLLYMLKIIDYGELQKSYKWDLKCGSG